MATIWSPFSLTDAWRDSTLFEGQLLKQELEFDNLLLTGDGGTNRLVPIPDLSREGDRSEGDAAIVKQNVAQIDGLQLPEVTSPQGDCWNQDFTPVVTSGSLLTWDEPARIAHSFYTSDLSETAFDSLAQRWRPNVGVLPRDFALHSLCSLALGRASIQYQWDGRLDSFKPTLSKVAISGCTTDTTDEVVEQIVKQGTLMRRLRSLSTKARSSRHKTAVIMGFDATLNNVLDMIEEHMVTSFAGIRTLSQLVHLTARFAPLLELCWKLSNDVRQANSDGEIITMLSTEVQTLAALGDRYTDVTKLVLQTTMLPWITQILTSLGIVAGSHCESEPTSLTSGTRLELLPKEHAASVHAVVEGRRLLLKHDPEHPLVSGAVAHRSQELNTTVDGLLERARHFQEELRTYTTARGPSSNVKIDSIDASRAVALQHGLSNSALPRDHRDAATLMEWSAFEEPAFATLEMPEQRGATSKSTNTLLASCIHRLVENPPDEVFPDLESLQYVEPTAALLGIIALQCRLVDQAVLELLVQQYQLGDVFTLHKDHFLLQDPIFLGRLKTAFFDDDSDVSTYAGNGRRRTGLRLNSYNRIKWPPSSSDLSLTLIGILPEHSTDLSFAVRELSEEEIERVCVPSSSHALDFVKLQYAATSPLDTIFTSELSKWYDEIFSTMLLHSRMAHLATDMRVQLLKRKNGQSMRDHEGQRQAYYVHKVFHLASVMISHAVELAAAQPWHQLELVMKKANTRSHDDQDADSITLSQIRQEHLRCLASIRKQLFLGKRYREVQTAIRKLYDLILQHAHLMWQVDHGSWQPRIAALIGWETTLLTILTTMKDKLNDSSAPDDTAEAELLDLLIAKLKQ